MTTSSRSEEVAGRTTTPSWRREAIELAALFVAVAVADLFANSLAHQPAGSVVLVGMGALLIGCAVAHRWWRHRSAPAPIAPVGAGPTPVDVRTTDVRTAAVWRVRATVRDTPGSLAALTASFARHGMNIVSVQVHGVPHGAVDEFFVEVPARATAEDIMAAVEAGGGRDASADRADPHDLVDVPARVLTTATRVVAGGVDLAEALRMLLGDCEMAWDPEGSGAESSAEGPAGTVLRLPDPAGGVLIVRRPSVAFTPAEFARARAMLDFDSRLAERTGRTVILLPTEGELAVRQAGPADVPRIADMHDRCSDRSRRQRYLGGVARPSTSDLQRMVSRRAGHTLVAEQPDGHIVAMANLVWDGDTAELAVLVEDAWQRRGIGTALLRRLAGVAETSGLESYYAVTEMTNRPMIRMLRRAGADPARNESGLAHLTIRPAAHGPA